MLIVPLHSSEDQTGRTWFLPFRESKQHYCSLLRDVDAASHSPWYRAFMCLIARNKSSYFHRPLHQERNDLMSVRKTSNMHPSFIWMEPDPSCNSWSTAIKPRCYRDENRTLRISILYSFVVFSAVFLPTWMGDWYYLWSIWNLSLPPHKKKKKIQSNQLMKKFRLRFISHLSYQNQETFYSGSWRVFDINPADIQRE